MEEASLAGLTLHVSDLERSLEFYKRLPGARVVVHRPDDFAMLRIGRGRLGLLQAKLPMAFHLEFETPNLNSFYDELRMAGIEPESPPQEREWGDMDFRVVDPDGNVVEFGVMRETTRASPRR